MNFYFFDFNYFSQFFGFIDVSIYKMISAVFGLGIILDRFLKNCIKLYKYCICFSSNVKGGEGSY